MALDELKYWLNSFKYIIAIVLALTIVAVIISQLQVIPGIPKIFSDTKTPLDNIPAATPPDSNGLDLNTSGDMNVFDGNISDQNTPNDTNAGGGGSGNGGSGEDDEDDGFDFPDALICGDGNCVSGETCSSCSADCGICPPTTACTDLNGTCFASCPTGQIQNSSGNTQCIQGQICCVQAPPPPDPSLSACEDGIDNDGDSYTDEADMGCANASGTYVASMASEASSSACNPRPDPNNLLLNGHIECGTANSPQNWAKLGDDASHLLTWPNLSIGGRNSRMLKTENLAGPNSDGTIGRLFLWKQSATLEPGTWYEFSFTFATEGIEPALMQSTGATSGYQEIWGSSSFIAGFLSLDDVGPNTGDSILGLWIKGASTGVQMTGWDPAKWVYTNFQTRGLENWRTVKNYFKTPSSLDGFSAPQFFASILTYNFPKGKGYFDNFSVKKVPGNTDPTNIPLKRSGTLNFIQYHQGDFFPIDLSGFPTQNSTTIPLSDIKNAGFNSTWKLNINMNETQARQAFIDADMAMVETVPSVHRYPGNSNNVNWLYPAPAYTGATDIVSRARLFASYQNLLMVSSHDELDCHAAREGTYLPNIQSYTSVISALKALNPQMHIYINHCDINPYTGVHQDLVDYYLPLSDIASLTNNAVNAYPITNPTPEQGQKQIALLPLVGSNLRKTIYSMQNSGNTTTRFIGVGYGFNCWAQWNGVSDPTYIYNCNKVTPFNVQRFQIWDQIINGAVGITFHGAYGLILDDPANGAYYSYQWEQIKIEAKELSDLYSVLARPQFGEDEWQISDSRINAMLKRSPANPNELYLFTASTSIYDIPNVTITLPGKTIQTVVALNEDGDGSLICSGCRRNITAENISGDHFTDAFGYTGTHQRPRTGNPGDPSPPPGGSEPTAAGYAVHIYRITVQ